eukprot:172497_1
MANTGPLSGVRVLDMTRVVAGPTCTQLLGDYGAEVIKVENPLTNGEPIRGAMYPRYVNNKNAKDSMHAIFMGLNRNKKSIAVNFHTKKGNQIIKDLIATQKFNVLVENYKHGDLDRFGLDYKSLSKIYPNLIYCSITAYGKHSNEYKNKKGYNMVFEALSGLIHINDGRRYAVPITDLLTGYLAFGAINSALYANKGQHLNVSLYDSGIASLMTHISSMYLYSNMEPKYIGNQHPFLVPNGLYNTKDGQIVLGVYSEKEWPVLCKVLGGDVFNKLYNDKNKRFSNNIGRVMNRKKFIEIFEGYLKTQTTKYWIDKIESSDVAKKLLIYSKVQKVSEAFKHPYTKLNNMLIDMPYNDIYGGKESKVKTVGFPIKMSETKPMIQYGVPQYAQHSVEVLKDYLGFDDKKIKLYKDEGVIQTFDVKKSKL